MKTKDEIRSEMKKLRREFENKQSAGKRICENILSLAEYKNASCVGIYMAAFGEADLKHIADDCKENGKTVVVPVTNKDTNEVLFSKTNGEFVKGAYGIYEPKYFKFVDFEMINFICIPGIAFDKDLNRIGFGKGCYDRVLGKMRAFRCGVCYDFQMLYKICADEHDIKMDAVVSETGIYR